MSDLDFELGPSDRSDWSFGLPPINKEHLWKEARHIQATRDAIGEAGCDAVMNAAYFMSMFGRTALDELEAVPEEAMERVVEWARMRAQWLEGLAGAGVEVVREEVMANDLKNKQSHADEVVGSFEQAEGIDYALAQSIVVQNSTETDSST